VAGTIDSDGDGRATAAPVAVIVAARDEAGSISSTLAALRAAFPTAALWVADDGSRDRTRALAEQAGAAVVRAVRPVGKGRAMTIAVERALAAHPGAGGDVFVLCDGDLGATAGSLAPLAAGVASGDADLAVAAFARPQGGGFGIALGCARWAIERACGVRLRAPISGQRALTRETLEAALPFAAGYGMELGMTIDAVRGGARVSELELELGHRPSGRDVAGFVHRARQLADFARAYARRR
jgi:glycosyltransferase involved in cell wall biosynthesis